MFTGIPRSIAGGSLGLDELVEDFFTLEDDRGRSVVAAALECVLAERPSDAVLGCSAEFLACFAPLAHAAALRVARDGPARSCQWPPCCRRSSDFFRGSLGCWRGLEHGRLVCWLVCARSHLW